MNEFLIFIWIYSAMIANSFWEAYSEGKNSWDKGKLGWKIRFRGKIVLTAYHFWLFFVMHPLMLTLPFVIFGFDVRIFGVVISAYLSGLVVQDFFWFIVNPTFNMKNWNPKYVTWYPWIQIFKFNIPLYYVIAVVLAVIFWIVLWR